MNILKEFWPQLRDRLRPITPKKLRKLEDHFTGYQDHSAEIAARETLK